MSVTITSATNPHSLNVSNHNFYSLWSSLGFNPVCGGELPASSLFNALKTFKPASITEASYIEGNFHHSGRTIQQTTRYYWELMHIVTHALEHNEAIYWS